MTFIVKRRDPSLLVLSQKYHRYWQAEALGQSGWMAARTTVFNGVFQAVLVPQDTQQVRLEFKPYARYAWGAHIFWLCLLISLVFITWQKRAKRTLA